MSDEKLNMILDNTHKILNKSSSHERLLDTLTNIAGGIQQELKNSNESRSAQTEVFKTALETIGASKPTPAAPIGIKEIAILLAILIIGMLAASKVINVQPVVDKYSTPGHVEFKENINIKEKQ
jgi:hypothetical protein